ncbi:helix-turn-helix transcriptional regulator [Aeromonas salmonicida]|uniref:helix-turn-helix transcriptional regulator n=1 Tax=Aeromonas salmonicida TaxID=645 RepID=UPI001BA6A3D3|nr:helix-turn-helix transcriptional regulator [Aeromonas salmonicida]MBS2781146.1 helix-turn-helix transcriptional regulator [Aeromonas salmonicida]
MDSLNLNAEELRDFRRVLDWSQQRMADELGVARNTINRMEKGHMAIEIRTALAVRYLAWHHSMIEKAPTKQPGQANVQAGPERGDADKQVDLLLPAPELKPDHKLDPASSAWEIYAPVFKDHPWGESLKERYFKVFHHIDTHYSYLFLLQLLERLANMGFNAGEVVYIRQYANYKDLRDYAQTLYKANPQWH